MCLAGPDYRRGDQHPEIAIVGACPGAEEEEQSRPFIGDAGAVLTQMITIINGISPYKFPSDIRDDYTLLNAHPVPRYNAPGQPKVRTQPTPAEVMEEQNFRRFAEQIRGTAIARLLLAGGRPQLFTQRVTAEFAGMEIFWCGHPSKTAWNTRYVGQSQVMKIRSWTQDTFKMVEPFHVVT